MKAIAIFSFILFINIAAHAQRSFGITVLPQVGISYANMNFDDRRTKDNFKPGLLLGSTFILDGQHRKFGLLVGLHYVQKGGQSNFKAVNSPTDYVYNTNNFRMNYLDYSLQGRMVLRADKKFKFFARAGLVFSSGLNGNAKTSYGEYQGGYLFNNGKEKNDIEFIPAKSRSNSYKEQPKGDLSSCVGIGVILFERITLDVGYSGGKLRMTLSDFKPLANNLFQFSVGYALKKNHF